MDKDKLALEFEIAGMILSIAELYNEVTTSDLQGLAQVEAMKIIKLIRG